MKNQRLKIIMTVIVILLLIPLIAMQLTNEVDWKINDFVIMGVLLIITGLLCELVMRKIKSMKSRILICGAVLLMFILI